MSDISEIVCNDNGPLRVTGANITLKDSKGNVYGLAGRTTISLCRCGMSQNKPFCDGSHCNGFQSVCTATELPPPKPKL
jgi:CDGSH-type Zn-finger protein